MKPKILDLRGMKTRIRKASDYIVEIVSEAYPMSEEDKQELRETIETEVYDLLDEIRQRIKSACEFYLRYKNDPELLIEEHPEYIKKKIAILDIFDKSAKTVSLQDFISIINKMNYENYSKQIENSFNEWLFKLAFKKVIGEKNG